MKKIVELCKRISLIFSVLIFLASFVCAAPTTPIAPDTLTQQSTSTMDTANYPPRSLTAVAGNLSQLSIVTRSQTQHWQGYYGNISGTIVLDDAYNFTMYQWDLAEPQGEVYVVNTTSIDWLTVHCLNYTAGGTTHTFQYNGSTTTTTLYANLSILETFYGLSPQDVDGFNETFRLNATGDYKGILSDGITLHNEFYVGTVGIHEGSCPTTDMYENDSSIGVNFQEVLLTWNHTSSVMFTAIIENDILDNDTDNFGYNKRLWDFQLIVAEDGYTESGQDTTTTYYFYVELS